jgi:integrase
VTDRGVRSYILQYRMGGRGQVTKTFTIGRHGSPWTAENAREHAADLLEQIRKGIDPQQERADQERRQHDLQHAAEQLGFCRYADVFILRHVEAKALRSIDDIKAVIRRDLAPTFGDKPINEIKRSDVTKLLEDIADRSGSAANKAHKWLKKMLNFAVDRGDLESSPMAGMKPPYREQKRERVLNDDEIRIIWNASDSLGYPFGPFVKLLILSGQRLREVAKMRWEEISPDMSEWTIPGLRAKNKNDHLVPTSSLFRSVLAEIKALKVDPELIFTTNHVTPISGFSKAKKRIDLLICKSDATAALPAWTFHDFRRTAATGCQRLGVPIDHTEALLNHTGRRSGIVSVYQLYEYRDEKAEAIEKWGELVQSIVREN